MDLDIEMGDGEGAIEHQEPIMSTADDILQPDEPEEPGEIADDEPTKEENDESTIVVPTKLHLRGVDTLHTDDIKAYVKTNYGQVDRIEWIDDTSANLLFSNEAAARDAIVALSAIEIADATALPVGEVLPAKPVADKPETTLTIRFAVESDKKQAGAALRSRYYLLHPEHDPEEKRRRHNENRNRYRDRDGYDRRRSDRRRRDSDEIETFEASMYDDAPRSERRRSGSGDRDQDRRSYANENRGKELFGGDRPSRKDRNRSASPMRDRDGDAAMDAGDNRSRARDIRGRLSENRSKELFPSKVAGRGGQLDRLEDAIGSAHLKEEDMPKVAGGGFHIRGAATERGEGGSGFSIKGSANAKELFPGKLGNDNSGKELFDGRSKQRQKAQDLFG